MPLSQLPDTLSMQVNIPIDDDGYLDRACPNVVCEAGYKILADDWKDKVHNLFQNLPQSSDLWEQAIGLRYEAMLTPDEWNQLQRYFQQRHILAHCDGTVGQEYQQKTVDRQYQSGQRLVYARHGRELVGLKSPVSVPVLSE